MNEGSSSNANTAAGVSVVAMENNYLFNNNEFPPIGGIAGGAAMDLEFQPDAAVAPGVPEETEPGLSSLRCQLCAAVAGKKVFYYKDQKQLTRHIADLHRQTEKKHVCPNGLQCMGGNRADNPAPAMFKRNFHLSRHLKTCNINLLLHLHAATASSSAAVTAAAFIASSSLPSPVPSSSTSTSTSPNLALENNYNNHVSTTTTPSLPALNSILASVPLPAALDNSHSNISLPRFSTSFNNNSANLTVPPPLPLPTLTNSFTNSSTPVAHVALNNDYNDSSTTVAMNYNDTPFSPLSLFPIFECKVCDTSFTVKAYYVKHLSCLKHRNNLYVLEHGSAEVPVAEGGKRKRKEEDSDSDSEADYEDVEILQTDQPSSSAIKGDKFIRGDAVVLPCPLCPRTFKLQKRLDQHVTIHSRIPKQKPVEICGNCFKAKALKRGGRKVVMGMEAVSPSNQTTVVPLDEQSALENVDTFPLSQIEIAQAGPSSILAQAEDQSPVRAHEDPLEEDGQSPVLQQADPFSAIAQADQSPNLAQEGPSSDFAPADPASEYCSCVRIYRCSVCFRVLVNNSSLHAHMRTHIAGRKESVLCGVDGCTSLFSSKKSRQFHVKAKHTKEGVTKYYCAICPAEFVYKITRDRHQVKMHKEKTTVAGPSSAAAEVVHPVTVAGLPALTFEDAPTFPFEGVPAEDSLNGGEDELGDEGTSLSQLLTGFGHPRTLEAGGRNIACHFPNCMVRFKRLYDFERHWATHLA